MTQTIKVKAGDRAALFSYLKTLGVTDDRIEDLDVAITEDEKESPRQGLGPRTQAWLGRLMTHAGKLGVGVGVGATGELVAQALGMYFGLQ